MMRSWRVVALKMSVCFAFVFVVDAASCRLCEYGPESVPDPTKQIVDLLIAPSNATCGYLENNAKSVEEESEACDDFRAVATRCGCNVPPDACELCWDQSAITQPTSELPEYESEVYTTMTCQNLQAHLHQDREEDDPECNFFQHLIGERCGCPPFPDDESSLDDEMCTLCFDGKPPLYGDREVHGFSCSDVALWATFLPLESLNCTIIQGFGRKCGCSEPPGACSLCPNGEGVPNRDQPLDDVFIGAIPDAFTFFEIFIVGTSTCGTTEDLLFAAAPLGVDDLLCWSFQMTSSVCGCSPLTFAVVLTWVYRISGLLSFLVSCQ